MAKIKGDKPSIGVRFLLQQGYENFVYRPPNTNDPKYIKAKLLVDSWQK
jgi:hypothetical protein